VRLTSKSSWTETLAILPISLSSEPTTEKLIALRVPTLYAKRVMPLALHQRFWNNQNPALYWAIKFCFLLGQISIFPAAVKRAGWGVLAAFVARRGPEMGTCLLPGKPGTQTPMCVRVCIRSGQ